MRLPCQSGGLQGRARPGVAKQLLANAMELDKIRASLICEGDAPHNHHMFTALDKRIVQQTLRDHIDESLR